MCSWYLSFLTVSNLLFHLTGSKEKVKGCIQEPRQEHGWQ